MFLCFHKCIIHFTNSESWIVTYLHGLHYNMIKINAENVFIYYANDQLSNRKKVLYCYQSFESFLVVGQKCGSIHEHIKTRTIVNKNLQLHYSI